MNQEIFEKKMIEINHKLRENIGRFPNLNGKISLALNLKDGGIIDYIIFIEEKNKFRLN